MIISKFSFMLVEIFVHMSLLNMLIYIQNVDVLCVPLTIYFYGLKYLSHCFNMSDIYLTCLSLIHDK